VRPGLGADCQSDSQSALGVRDRDARRLERTGATSPLRRRPAVVRLRSADAHRLGRLYATSETEPEIEVPGVLGGFRFAMPPEWPSLGHLDTVP
jgi:hypothetical protein